MSNDQKRELLEALWSIIVGFVDLGFTVETTATASEKNSRDGTIEPLAADESFVVRSDIPSSTQPFEKAAGVARDVGGA